MRPLHIRLVAHDPESDELLRLVTLLREAGHFVAWQDDQIAPPPYAPQPDLIVTEGALLPAAESLAAAEARHIRAVLEYTRGNRRQAALLLGIARSTLLAKIRRAFG